MRPLTNWPLFPLVMTGALPLNARRPVVFLLALVVLVALIGGLSYFQFVIKPTSSRTPSAPPSRRSRRRLRSRRRKSSNGRRKLPAIGTLRAYQGIVVAPQVAGVVTAIHFESGDDVAAGAPLLNLDNSVEQADLANGLAQLKNADVDARRASRRWSPAAIRRNRRSTRRWRRAIRPPRPSSARARSSPRRRSRRRSPAGSACATSISASMSPSAPSLITLQQLDPIYVDFPSPEEALSTLAVGQEASMSVDAFPGRSFTGKVKAIDARVSADSRNVTVRAEFANPDRKLLPGMFANVTVTTGAPAEVLTAAAHRDRLQPLWRQRLRREAARRRQGRAKRPGGDEAAQTASSSSGASCGSARRAASGSRSTRG